MSNIGINIYSKCRQTAGLTQEQAAEQLGCGVRTLASWETGVNLPPDNKVMKMCRLYRCPALSVAHLRQSSELARGLLPETHEKSLAEAVLGLLSAIRMFNTAELDWGLMEIAADGSISPDERRGFEILMYRLEGIIEASYELRLSREAQIKKPADAEAPTGHVD